MFGFWVHFRFLAKLQKYGPNKYNNVAPIVGVWGMYWHAKGAKAEHSN